MKNSTITKSEDCQTKKGRDFLKSSIKMKKTYYHAVTMDKMVSIMKHGLLRNMSDTGVYFTDDAISSLDWIKCRNEVWLNRKDKALGLVIFEVDTDDEALVPFKDYKQVEDPAYPQLLKEAQKAECVIYRNSIHPSKLKFEECVIDGDDYDCYPKTNTHKYVPVNKRKMIDIVVDGLQYVCGYDYKTGKYVNHMKDFYLQLKSNPRKAEEYYDHCLQYWKN